MKNSSVIYFVRHGEVENPEEVIPGRLSGFGLNSEGRIQAEIVGRFLAKSPIKVIYSSPLERTLETAKIVAKYFPKIKIKKTQLLTEGDIGWEGRKKEEIRKSGEWQVYLEKPSKIQGRENFRMIAKRGEKAVQKILKVHQSSEVICVTHKDLIRSLRLKLEKKSLNLLNKIPCDRCSVTKFLFDAGGVFKKVVYYDFEKVGRVAGG